MFSKLRGKKATPAGSSSYTAVNPAKQRDIDTKSFWVRFYSLVVLLSVTLGLLGVVILIHRKVPDGAKSEYKFPGVTKRHVDTENGYNHVAPPTRPATDGQDTRHPRAVLVERESADGDALPKLSQRACEEGQTETCMPKRLGRRGDRCECLPKTSIICPETMLRECSIKANGIEGCTCTCPSGQVSQCPHLARSRKRRVLNIDGTNTVHVSIPTEYPGCQCIPDPAQACEAPFELDPDCPPSAPSCNRCRCPKGMRESCKGTKISIPGKRATDLPLNSDCTCVPEICEAPLQPNCTTVTSGLGVACHGCMCPDGRNMVCPTPGSFHGCTCGPPPVICLLPLLKNCTQISASEETCSGCKCPGNGQLTCETDDREPSDFSGCSCSEMCPSNFNGTCTTLAAVVSDQVCNCTCPEGTEKSCPANTVDGGTLASFEACACLPPAIRTCPLGFNGTCSTTVSGVETCDCTCPGDPGLSCPQGAESNGTFADFEKCDCLKTCPSGFSGMCVTSGSIGVEVCDCTCPKDKEISCPLNMKEVRSFAGFKQCSCSLPAVKACPGGFNGACTTSKGIEICNCACPGTSKKSCPPGTEEDGSLASFEVCSFLPPDCNPDTEEKVCTDPRNPNTCRCEPKAIVGPTDICKPNQTRVCTPPSSSNCSCVGDPVVPPVDCKAGERKLCGDEECACMPDPGEPCTNGTKVCNGAGLDCICIPAGAVVPLGDPTDTGKVPEPGRPDSTVPPETEHPITDTQKPNPDGTNPGGKELITNPPDEPSDWTSDNSAPSGGKPPTDDPPSTNPDDDGSTVPPVGVVADPESEDPPTGQPEPPDASDASPPTQDSNPEQPLNDSTNPQTSPDSLLDGSSNQPPNTPANHPQVLPENQSPNSPDGQPPNALPPAQPQNQPPNAPDSDPAVPPADDTDSQDIPDQSSQPENAPDGGNDDGSGGGGGDGGGNDADRDPLGFTSWSFSQSILGSHAPLVIARVFASVFGSASISIANFEPVRQLLSDGGASGAALTGNPIALAPVFMAGLFVDLGSAVATDVVFLDTNYCANPVPDSLNPCPARISSNKWALDVMTGSLTVVAVSLVYVIALWLKTPKTVMANTTSLAGVATIMGHPEVERDFAVAADMSDRGLALHLNEKKYALGAYHDRQVGAERFGIMPLVLSGDSQRKRSIWRRLEGSVVEAKAKGFKDWHRGRTYSDIAFLVLAVALLGVTITTVAHVDDPDRVYKYRSRSTTIGFRVGFAILAIVVARYWTMVFQDVQNFAQFTRLHAGPQEAKMTINKKGYALPILAIVPLIKAGYLVPAAAAVVTLLSEVFVVALAGLPYRPGQLRAEFLFCGIASIVLLVLMIIMLGVVVWWRRKLPHLPRKPNNVAAVMTYLAETTMTRDFEGMAGRKRKERDREIEGLCKRYAYGLRVDEEGRKRWVVDEVGMGTGDYESDQRRMFEEGEQNRDQDYDPSPRVWY